MSISEQVADATFLAQHGRFVGALTTLLVAVAASARRTFPKGTRSRTDPQKDMGDREAFTLFLGGRIRRILMGHHGGPDEGNSGVLLRFRGAEHDLAYILYKYYRCELVHEGTLPPDVEFGPFIQPQAGITFQAAGAPKFGISTAGKLRLDHGWIDVLIGAVVNARCNGAEFGIEHFDLVFNGPDTEEAFFQAVVERNQTTPGRVSIMRDVVRRLSPEQVLGSDAQLEARFSELVNTGWLIGGAITGLRHHEFVDADANLTASGIRLLRDIAGSYTLIKV